ncbi:hypothetical protein GYH30_026454 [Glycine max]|nr:hypothetical protein GYH30_026454 [Glycine max]
MKASSNLNFYSYFVVRNLYHLMVFYCFLFFIALMNGVLERIASKAHELAHYHSGDEDGIYLAYSKQLDTFTQVF